MRIPTSSERYVPTFDRRTFLAGGIAGLAALMTGCGSDLLPADSDIPDLGYPDSGIFVSPQWLASMIDREEVRILDCSDLATYRRGHIPGAHHIWWQDTIEVHNPVYGMLVNPEARATLVDRAGIEPGMFAVCYDDSGGVHAARVAWTLRYMGFRSTHLLVGGTRGWRGAGYDLSRQAPDSSSGAIPDIFDESIVANAQDIVARMNEPGLVLLDTRTQTERDETWNDRLRIGVIPTSVWLPRDRLIDEHDIPVPASEFVMLLEALVSLEDTVEVIVYGLHGTLAALPYYVTLALDRFHVRLYDGSWSQWGADPDLPIEPLEG